ncbi:conjugal transfer protein [Ornithinibacillus contaminans]|uniref:conjugal transfer protein n=1 Tax=Ornithinibacillus contaminans TaxID=694055 RepID=UPI0006A79B04|nr:conjugal transfer protein [Ornithinibacillus contaminans]
MKKKKGFFRTIKKVYNYFFRDYKYQKEKKLQRKAAKKASIKPKGFIAKKSGVIIFWVTFGFMFLVVFSTLFSGDSSEAKTKEVSNVKNLAASAEGIQFAKNFTRDYFTWEVSDKGKSVRKETMSKYLADGLDEYAGISFNGLQWNSNFVDSEVKEVVENGENLALITLLTRFELRSVDGNDTKKIEKYFVIPVAYDGKTFGVYELPKFTFIQENTTLQKVVSNKLNRAETSIAGEIKEFLPTFLKSYAEDTKDKLNYILTEENVTDGLQGMMKFSDVKEANVFVGEQPDHYVVFATVIFLEPETNLAIETNYHITVVNRDDRYIVSGINDQENMIIKSDTDEVVDEQGTELEETSENN